MVSPVTYNSEDEQGKPDLIHDGGLFLLAIHFDRD